MCGIIGIANAEQAAPLLREALLQLQHRGQDSCGIVTSGEWKFNTKRGPGDIDEALPKDLSFLSGRDGIGHVRYSTFGATDWEELKKNVQPQWVGFPFSIAMAHNGNITNPREVCHKYGFEPETNVDIEYILKPFALELGNATTEDVENGHLMEAAHNIMQTVNGAYSVVGLVRCKSGECKLFAFADPHKIRPLVYGVQGGSFAFASETVALDALGYEILGDVKPGEIVIVDGDELAQEQVCPGEPRHCFFEWIYFSRPSSVIEGISVYEARKRAGIQLAKREDVDFDTISYVPDSGRQFGEGFCEVLQKPLYDTLDKLRPAQRTFIARKQIRHREVRRKYNPIRKSVEGRKIIICDDSLIRGNTSRRIAALLYRTGAGEVHWRVTAKVTSPCFYGIDMPTYRHFVGRDRSDEETARKIGVDTFRANTPDEIARAIGLPLNNLCMGCIGGKYATDVSHLLERADGEIRPYEC